MVVVVVEVVLLKYFDLIVDGYSIDNIVVVKEGVLEWIEVESCKCVVVEVDVVLVVDIVVEDKDDIGVVLVVDVVVNVSDIVVNVFDVDVVVDDDDVDDIVVNDVLILICAT